MTSALAALLGWSAGLAAVEVLLPQQPLAGALALLGAGLGLVGALAIRPAAIGLAIAAVCLGAARAELPAGDPHAAARAPTLAGLQAVVEGSVTDDPRPLGAGYEVLVMPDHVATGAGPRLAAGKVLVRVNGLANEPAPGDRVQATGRLDLPRDRPGFDRRAYLAQQGAYLEMRTATLTVVHRRAGVRALPGWLRERYRQAITELLPQPHAALLVGVVLGVRAGIPNRLQQDLVATGLVHLLVLSGLKVAIFARLVTTALSPLLGRAATLPALGLIGLYALAGGATPAAIRAAAMGGLTLAAAHLGRPTHVWTSLAATAAAMLAWRPDLVWDVGFQLSFSGTAAIILLTPGFEQRLHWVPGFLREPFAVTCAAQVGTVPFMASSFHLLSPAGPFANAAVLPLLPAMVAAGLLVAPLAVFPEVGRLAALPLAGLLAYLEQVAGFLARAPAASLPVPDFRPSAGIAYYLGLGGAMVAANSRGTARRAAILLGVLAPLVIGAGELAAWGRPAASVAVLAVGEGQAILVSGPAGNILVDGGSSPSRLAGELGSRLPPWRRQLEALVITGPGLGHVGGLADLPYPAGQVVVADGDFGGAAERKAALLEVARGAQLKQVAAGQLLSIAGLRLEILSPERRSPEPGQLAFRIVGPHQVFCDLADLDPDGQTAAAARLRGACDYLLLPAGGRSAPAPELQAIARPGRFVISDAGGRLARDLPRGAIARTSEEGTIVLPL